MKVHLLLGGFVGIDGYLTSSGMYMLSHMLTEKGIACQTYQWADYQSAYKDIMLIAGHGDKQVVVGYSGGGSRATWLANVKPTPQIELMVLYDPSPTWQMEPIGDNVKRAVSYTNKTPFFFGLGGGVLKGPHVEIEPIAMNHMLVQSSMDLHRNTVALIQALR